MGKPLTLTSDQLQYLREASASNVPATTMAKHIGCCTDTLKRILMRHNIAYYDGAKYATSRTHNTETWTRPCMCCKTTAPRPRWQYVCDKCRADNSDIEDIF